MARYVITDIETTGNQTKGHDRMIQIAIVVVEDGKIVQEYASFVNPQRSIPPFVSDLTGISAIDVQNAPTFKEIAKEVKEICKDSIFVAHNVQFDLTFLNYELELNGFSPVKCQAIDTVELTKIFYPTLPSYKLMDIATYFGYTHLRPHQADSDAYATALLLLDILDKVKSLPIETIEKLIPLSSKWRSHFTNHLIDIQMELLTKPKAQSLEYEYQRGFALKKPKREFSFTDYSIGFDTLLEETFLQVDYMKKIFPSFEMREEQLEMIRAVWKSFIENKTLIIEASTGSGKTLAYLFSSVLLSKLTARPVVISTETIQQQQQIREKEIPLLQKMLPFDFLVTVMKGKQHYLCLHKFEQALFLPETNYEAVILKSQILIWILETETGDVDELNISSGGQLYWQRISSEGDQTDRDRNPWDEFCYYQRAKSLLIVADLIITNHSYMLHEITKNFHFLKGAGGLVIDEAHQLEKIAAEVFGSNLNYHAMVKWYSRWGLKEQDFVLNKIFNYSKQFDPSLLPSLHKLEELMKIYRYEAEELFRYIRNVCVGDNVEAGKKTISISKTTPIYKEMFHILERLQFLLKDILQIGKSLEKRLEKSFYNGNIGYKYAHAIREIGYGLDEISNVMTQLKEFFEKDEEHVLWVEADSKLSYHHVWLRKQAKQTDELLQKHLFSLDGGIVLTSGTLRVMNDFAYCLREWGLVEEQVNTLAINSTFPYKENVKLYVPNDIAIIQNTPQQEFVEQLASKLLMIARKTKGRMLILFTSHELLKYTYNEMKENMAEDEFVLIGQGVTSGSAQKLTKSFVHYNNSILLGTSTFWEGVDIPGDDLVCLCIVRLPFTSPDKPNFARKMQLSKERGENPFYSLSLPDAIIKFRQGFGRLIRKETDYGVVVVFDRRLTESKYGHFFIEALPEVDVITKPLKQIGSDIQAFLKEKEKVSKKKK